MEGRGSRAVMGRTRWVGAFVALLAVSSAGPVLTAGASELGPMQPEVGVESGPVSPPGAQQVAASLAEVEQENASRELELQIPEAIREREESRAAFAEFSAAEARELLLTTFSAELANLNADPARYLSDITVVKAFGKTAATVRDDGDGSLLEAGIPIRVEDDDGALRKVDLDLTLTEGGFEPENPVTEVSIPETAGGAIAVGDRGLAITVVGAEGEAQPFGDKDVYYPNVHTDTDLLVAPTASGVELFDQLRSAASPEALHFRIALPEGAELHRSSSGGAEITENGNTIAYVSPPSAVDAQGKIVPVQLEVDGSVVTVQVPHRDRDFAYPILVDPAISENFLESWYWGGGLEALNLGIWGYDTNDKEERYILHNFFCLSGALCSPSGRGLFISTLNRNIPPGVYAQWYYNVPGGTTFIPSLFPEASATFYPFFRNNEGCNFNNYPEPHDYDGAYDAAGNWIYFETDRAQWVGSASVFTKAKGIAFGMSSGSGVNIPCWRNIMAGGVSVRLDDPEPPTLTSVFGLPTNWIGGAATFGATVNINDPGLGVRNVRIFPAGKPHIPYVSEAVECPGTKTRPCPSFVAAQFNLTAGQFDEGEKKVEISGSDPTGKVSNTFTTKLRVDRTPPDVALAGQLALATKETEGDAKDPEKFDELSLPVYNLKIEATDGSNATEAQRRSGVRDIEIFLDDRTTEEPVPWQAQTCPASSCPMTRTYQLKLGGLSAGKHTLKVFAVDQVGESRKREIEFEYVPATGIKDEYAMHYFDLPDGEDHSDEEVSRGPELAVNVMNGNLVYHERDLDVEGFAADLEVERFYNSQLPTSENTEWGDGWTLAQTPDLKPVDTGGSPAADEAELLDASGAIDSDVTLPVESGQRRFDPALQATLTKESGGYEFRDETGATDTAIAFDAAGRTEELRVPGFGSIEYDYAGGALAEIAVDDPASTTEAPKPIVNALPAFPAPKYIDSFGSLGAGNGQLSRPGGLARDANGNLWVVDRDNYRVQKFNEAGQYLSQFGGKGSANGQFLAPTSLAIGLKGELWIVDGLKLKAFNQKGEFIRQFGVIGEAPGQLMEPAGIAVTAKGHVLVSDGWNGWVQEFNEAGEFIKVLAPYGSAPGRVEEPNGVAVGPNGNIWIVDNRTNRVEVFNEAGQFLRQFGSRGSGDGQFQRPHLVAVDSGGRVWISDPSNGRIQAFTEAGEYLAQFGSNEFGESEFNSMSGIAANNGSIWVADGSHRIQRWQIPAPAPATPSYSSFFGSFGTGDGQFNRPADVAVDPSGNLWVVDQENSRIEKFNAQGEYIAQFGSVGSADGQLRRPAALAIDAKGNIWVADKGNGRVQKFSPEGKYLAKFGSVGIGNGQFASGGPEGIALDAKGNVWVADTYAGRVQKFNEAGGFIKVISSRGSGAGQLGEPTGIDIDPGGNLWVADWQNNRVAVFNEAGEFVRQFGTPGVGNGQFNRPDEVEVDAKGQVWVGDQNNDRVQQFTLAGEYVAQFGSKGSGEGQFSFGFPLGLATDSSGAIWVADGNNNRVQRWKARGTRAAAEVVPVDDDPAVEVDTSGGLVTGVEGEEAGTLTYTHSGDLLTSVSGPDGETAYEYDGAGRMTKVTLPNGTRGEIAYDSANGRVKSVTVAPEGANPKTTHFEYSDEPRRTTVTPPDAPVLTYDIAADGSVFKWRNTVRPPDLDDIAGSLFAAREIATPVTVGLHDLLVQAHSEEGIASILVVAGDDTVVDERSCSQDPGSPGIECIDLSTEWVVETGSLTPGILQLEVLVEDRLGGVATQKFWVNIPYTPPPPPEQERMPTFSEIRVFRQQYGLDLDLDPVEDEQEINDRIFDLIAAWGNPQTPLGEVARATTARWGMPQRPVDAAEMEHRERYLAINGPLIDEWGYTNHPNTYAGYEMDHAAGGILRVGFTQNQAARVAEFLHQIHPLAADRITAYLSVPPRTRLSLEELEAKVVNAADSDPQLSSLVAEVGVSDGANKVTVGTGNVAATRERMLQLLGSLDGIDIAFQPELPELQSARDRQTGRMLAGDWVWTDWTPSESPLFTRGTAGFGAYEDTFVRQDRKVIRTRFLLAAGHMGATGTFMYRLANPDATPENKRKNGEKIGRVGRNPHFEGSGRIDALAMRFNANGIAPHNIFGEGGRRPPIGPAGVARRGQRLCVSGAKTNRVKCGDVVGVKYVKFDRGDTKSHGVLVVDGLATRIGDSGAPVWNPRTGEAIGMVSGGLLRGDVSFIQPLRNTPTGRNTHITGALNASLMGDLHIITGE